MMSGIYNEFGEYNQMFDREKARLERLIHRHQQTLDNLERRHQGWFDRVLVPLAVHISAELGGLPYEFYGPFGLRCATTVYFFVGTGRNICEDETYSLTVYPEFGDEKPFFLSYDTGKRKDFYRPGSLGYLNSMNNIAEELPDSLEEIMVLLSHNHSEEGAKC